MDELSSLDKTAGQSLKDCSHECSWDVHANNKYHQPLQKPIPTCIYVCRRHQHETDLKCHGLSALLAISCHSQNNSRIQTATKRSVQLHIHKGEKISGDESTDPFWLYTTYPVFAAETVYILHVCAFFKASVLPWICVGFEKKHVFLRLPSLTCLLLPVWAAPLRVREALAEQPAAARFEDKYQKWCMDSR